MYIIEEFSQLANQELFPISIMQLQFILLSFNYSRLNAVEQSTNLFLQPDKCGKLEAHVMLLLGRNDRKVKVLTVVNTNFGF